MLEIPAELSARLRSAAGGWNTETQRTQLFTMELSAQKHDGNMTFLPFSRLTETHLLPFKTVTVSVADLVRISGGKIIHHILNNSANQKPQTRTWMFTGDSCCCQT